MTPVRVTGQPEPHPSPDQPRQLSAGSSGSDKIFKYGLTAVGSVVLVLTVSIGIFLGEQLIPTLHRYGLGFLTGNQFNPMRNKIGISSAIIGSFEVSIVAIVISFPLSLLLALYVSQYSPRWAKGTLVAIVDLMAAVPSIVYGLWGRSLLADHAIYVSRWLAQYLGWLPIFKVDTDPNAAVWSQTRFTTSAFFAGIAVSMMVIPISAAVMRGVFDQAPPGEREAAFALGATRWGMIRNVVLPFGRGGIIGGTMLGLGRALGETVAVLLIVSDQDQAHLSLIQTGVRTISSLIAGKFDEATSAQLHALLAAGFVLFVITIIVNTLAGVVVSRSRSGAGTDA